MSSSVLFWYFLISLNATVPGRNLCGFFTPPVAGADFRAAFVASCFLGALPPVDFLAVCFVRAIKERDEQRAKEGGGGWLGLALLGDEERAFRDQKLYSVEESGETSNFWTKEWRE